MPKRLAVRPSSLLAGPQPSTELPRRRHSHRIHSNIILEILQIKSFASSKAREPFPVGDTALDPAIDGLVPQTRIEIPQDNAPVAPDHRRVQPADLLWLKIQSRSFGVKGKVMQGIVQRDFRNFTTAADHEAFVVKE